MHPQTLNLSDRTVAHIAKSMSRELYSQFGPILQEHCRALEAVSKKPSDDDLSSDGASSATLSQETTPAPINVRIANADPANLGWLCEQFAQLQYDHMLMSETVTPEQVKAMQAVESILETIGNTHALIYPTQRRPENAAT